MPRRACRKDANHDEIRDALRQLGWDVIETYQFAQYDPGFPDLLCEKRGVIVFVEVKAEGGKLTKDEKAWCLAHKGMRWTILRTVGECVLFDATMRGAIDGLDKWADVDQGAKGNCTSGRRFQKTT